MIGVVENAILARIKQAVAEKAMPYGFRSYETWPKQFDEYLLEQNPQMPAVWVAFGGAHKIAIVTRGRHRAHCTFGVIVAAENLRNEETRRHGGTAAEPGSYQMAADMIRLLADQTLGLDIDALAPVSILPVETSDVPRLKQISLYAVTFETAIYLNAMPDVSPDEALTPFTTFHANWDPAPFGHVDADPATPGVQIPDDPHAVASDTIILDQS